MGSIRAPMERLHFLIVTCAICTLALIALVYTESITWQSPASLFKFKTSAAQNIKPVRAKIARRREDEKTLIMEEKDKEQLNLAKGDRFVTEGKQCSDFGNGEWVFSNSSARPLYSDRTCRYLDRQFSCVKNGPNDSDYLHWEWQPYDCVLPRFDPKVAVEKLRGKRLMFVGDSLQRNQWQSFVCLVQSVIPEDQKLMKRGSSHSVFSLTGECHQQDHIQIQLPFLKVIQSCKLAGIRQTLTMMRRSST